MGDCLPEGSSAISSNTCEYTVDPNVSSISLIFTLKNYIKLFSCFQRAATARWDEASKVTIKVMTKPCPKCRTPTERAGIKLISKMSSC